MKRSTIIAVGLLVLGTYALVRAQVATPPAKELPAEVSDRWADDGPVQGIRRKVDLDEIRRRAEVLSSHGDLDAAISLLQNLKKNADLTSALTPAEREVLTNIVARQKLKEKSDDAVQSQASKSPQAHGRYQLIGESGWVYRIDTATGEVLGMSVGNQDWVRVGQKIVDKLPITVETN